MAIIQWNKKYTETLAETLKRFRDTRPEFRDEKVTYAGRLDPMAEGLVILLTGNDVYKKDEFLGLDKIYEIDFIFGVGTDTYDILGILKNSVENNFSIKIDDLKNILNRNICRIIQEYPPFSSRTINGKPLFFWTRENRLDEIIIPKKEVEIYDIEYLGSREYSVIDFVKNVINDISLVRGDFRQDDIIFSWNDFQSNHFSNVITYTIRVKASSGTYMRSLINKIGDDIGIPSVSVKIKRISIGDYKLR